MGLLTPLGCTSRSIKKERGIAILIQLDLFIDSRLSKK